MTSKNNENFGVPAPVHASRMPSGGGVGQRRARFGTYGPRPRQCARAASSSLLSPSGTMQLAPLSPSSLCSSASHGCGSCADGSGLTWGQHERRKVAAPAHRARRAAPRGSTPPMLDARGVELVAAAQGAAQLGRHDRLQADRAQRLVPIAGLAASLKVATPHLRGVASPSCARRVHGAIEHAELNSVARASGFSQTGHASAGEGDKRSLTQNTTGISLKLKLVKIAMHRLCWDRCCVKNKGMSTTIVIIKKNAVHTRLIGVPQTCPATRRKRAPLTTCAIRRQGVECKGPGA
eukprot:CAMPEP_0198525194 /NCGR_PEP_ID=MMETSP1462-20131121/23206_1 /TAXON_ID=1333877 /ORGANISM="Brandtodinium nutriculum, Strain RCC3387" /LENGTH=292 /DNA_ID=CAMNT_0044254943 /DNA_START=46 /DNA_END=921 /DNA_ORIENTATION=-